MTDRTGHYLMYPFSFAVGVEDPCIFGLVAVVTIGFLGFLAVHEFLWGNV